jgi:hypothetical protein
VAVDLVVEPERQLVKNRQFGWRAPEEAEVYSPLSLRFLFRCFPPCFVNIRRVIRPGSLGLGLISTPFLPQPAHVNLQNSIPRHFWSSLVIFGNPGVKDTR